MYGGNIAEVEAICGVALGMCLSVTSYIDDMGQYREYQNIHSFRHGMYTELGGFTDLCYYRYSLQIILKPCLVRYNTALFRRLIKVSDPGVI